MGTKSLDMARLTAEYLAGKAASTIAKENSVSVWSIITRLRKSGIEVRRTHNKRHCGPAKTTNFSLRELIDGLLLGDGSLDPDGILHLEQSDDRFGWLEQVQSLLLAVGATSKLIPIPPRTRVIDGREIHSRSGHVLYTPAYGELKAERRRWCPIQKKQVPLDLILTPTVVAQWFCGDGTCASTGTLTFCTNGFTREEVEFLIERLSTNIRIRALIGKTPREGQFTIHVGQRDEAVQLAELIRPLMPDCCLYKLRFVHPKLRLGRFSPAEIEEIRKRRSAGESLQSLANCFGVSSVMISNISRGRAYKKG